MENSCTVTDE